LGTLAAFVAGVLLGIGTRPARQKCSGDVIASAKKSAGRWTRPGVARSGQGIALYWACHNDSRGDPHSGSPREECSAVYHRAANWVKATDRGDRTKGVHP